MTGDIWKNDNPLFELIAPNLLIGPCIDNEENSFYKNFIT